MANAVILKKEAPAFTPGLKVIKADEYALFSSAEEVMDQARENAARIARDAEAGYQEQKTRGYRDGLEKARQAMAEASLANTLAIDDYQRNLKERTVGLVMAVVRKVLLDIDPGELVAAQVKKALETMKMRRQVLVRVHPVKAESLNRKLADIMEAYPGINLLEVKPDNTLAPDSMVLESETGIVDATLETQLAAIEKAFRQHAGLVEHRISNT
jgi:type III secretion protein L